MATHKIHWRLVRCSEFDGCNTRRTELFDSWEAANERVFELLRGHRDEYEGPTRLTIEWEDGDEIEPVYRRFEVFIPDRG